MKTNLIFKKQEQLAGGISKTITRIVCVDVPNIDAGQGWVLTGHTDVVEVETLGQVTPLLNSEQACTVAIPQETPTVLTTFDSPVSGTAKLVRSKGVIKIVARRGKSTFNKTSPNSVCISDKTKISFFADCRSINGADSGLYEFSMKDTPQAYDYWNKIIDTEYLRQQKCVITNLQKLKQ